MAARLWVRAGVAQLVEHFSCKEDVAGSTPVTGSIADDASGPQPGVHALIARYATRCAVCPRRIEPGEEIVAAKGGGKWLHAACEGAATTPAVAGPVPAGTTEVYTDGACRGNPGPGGWGWAVPDGPEGSGHDPATTNQRMEVRAAYEAIKALDGPLVVVSDSTYVVNCFKNSWWTGWRARGWVNSAKKPVANRDLWEPLIDLVEARGDVTFRWVKGHSGDPMNDLVDRLAVAASHLAG
jgi:ribonuclease HI